MEPRILPFAAIRPFVRFAEDIYIHHNHEQLVNTYDHRLFFVVKGSARFEINGQAKEVVPGMVLYWMSGTTYKFCFDQDVLHLISVNFDFTQAHAHTIEYLPMVSPQEYVPENRLENFLFEDAPAMNEPLVLPDLPEILPYLRAILQESAMPNSFGNVQLSNLMQIVLTLLCRKASQQQQIRSAINSANAVLEYVHEHYSEDLNNHILAEKFNYHPNYICRLIAIQTGIPLHKYLLKLRIKQGLHLLQTSDLSISEIASRVGFKSSSHFSQYFKQCTGYSPKQFRIR